jgi:hypothetical protein
LAALAGGVRATGDDFPAYGQDGKLVETIRRIAEVSRMRMLTQTGLKTILGLAAGVLLAPAAARADQVFPDDVIVQGSLCAGFDCVNGEAFDAVTLKLKENNTRILFDDTSTSSGFAANKWQLIANDIGAGGRNFFGIEDVTGGRIPFFVAAGARANAIHIASSGRVGFGTDNPGLALHAQTADTPGLRLEQTNAGGFTPQTWDVAGNEAGFFVRDVTNGNRLTFRIRPGAPTSSIDIAPNGSVGLGTASPEAKLHVSGTATADTFATFGSNAGGAALNPGGAGAQGLNVGHGGTALGGGTGFLNAFAEDGASGRLVLATNGAARVVVDGAGQVGIGTTTPGAQLSTTGTVRFAGLAGCASGLVTNASGDLGCGGGSGAAGLVQQDGATRAITVGAGADGTVVAFAGTQGDRRLTGVAAGTADTDAVNVAQLTAAVGSVSTASGPQPIRSNNTSNLPPPSAGGADALALGYGATASGDRSLAAGGSAVASGANATALGQGAQATFAGATALGSGARATADPTTAVGFQAAATADEASAFGAFATASAANTTALGRSAAAAGVGATAVGFQATASGTDAVALGRGAQAAPAGSIAIGAGVATTRANQVAIGSGQSTYTLAGIASDASRAAQSGPTRFVLADDNGNLATSDFDIRAVSRLSGRVEGLGERMAAAETRLDTLSAEVRGLSAQAWQMSRDIKKSYEGSAIAMAMGGAVLPPGKNAAVSANWGTYQGEHGFSASAVVKVTESAYVNGGVGVGSRGSMGGRAGLTWAW